MKKQSTKKVLIDNLGRIVGLVAPRTGKVGSNIEYGVVRDSVLDARGIARIARKKMDDWTIEHLRTYDGNTGRMINSDAAAAELLEVLKNIIDHMDDNPPRSKKTGKDKLWSEALFYRNREDARRAIAKAEGK